MSSPPPLPHSPVHSGLRVQTDQADVTKTASDNLMPVGFLQSTHAIVVASHVGAGWGRGRAADGQATGYLVVLVPAATPPSAADAAVSRDLLSFALTSAAPLAELGGVRSAHGSFMQ